MLLALFPLAVLLPQDIRGCKRGCGGSWSHGDLYNEHWLLGCLRGPCPEDPCPAAKTWLMIGIQWCCFPQAMARLAEVLSLPVPAHPGSQTPHWPCLNVSLKGFAGLPSGAVIWRLPFICSSVSGSRQRSLDP